MIIKSGVLVLLVLVLSVMVQPIFADISKDTEILTEFKTSSGKPTYAYDEIFITEPDKLKVKAWGKYESMFGKIPLIGRYLNIEVYKRNSDGSTAEIVFHKRKLTNIFTGTTKIDLKFPRGRYTLVISYDGNRKDQLLPSNTTKQLRFLQKI